MDSLFPINFRLKCESETNFPCDNPTLISNSENFSNRLLLTNSSSSTSSTSSFCLSSSSSTTVDSQLSKTINPSILINNPTHVPLPYSPAPSASSTSSSLSLSFDVNSTYLFNQFGQTSLPLINNLNRSEAKTNNFFRSNSYENFDFLTNNSLVNHNQQIINQNNFSAWNNYYYPSNSQISFNSSSNYNYNYGLKHDVSVGTDFLLSSQSYPNISNNMNFTKCINQKESFKLIEKIPIKKSRTKYTKDQVNTNFWT